MGLPVEITIMTLKDRLNLIWFHIFWHTEVTWQGHTKVVPRWLL